MRKPTRQLARRIDERKPAPYQQRSWVNHPVSGDAQSPHDSTEHLDTWRTLFIFDCRQVPHTNFGAFCNDFAGKPFCNRIPFKIRPILSVIFASSFSNTLSSPPPIFYRETSK